MVYWWPFSPLKRKKNITIEISKFDDNRHLLILQKKLSPKFNVKIHQPDVEHLQVSPEAVQILISMYVGTVKMIDGAVIGIIATEVYNNLKANKGSGIVQVIAEKRNGKLDSELNLKNPSKEDLELQIRRYADGILNNPFKEK